MNCFRKSSGIYVLNGTKKCRPVEKEDIEVEFQSVPDEIITTNGHAEAVPKEPEVRRAGIQAPVIEIDENVSSVKKYPKNAE